MAEHTPHSIPPKVYSHEQTCELFELARICIDYHILRGSHYHALLCKVLATPQIHLESILRLQLPPGSVMVFALIMISLMVVLHWYEGASQSDRGVSLNVRSGIPTEGVRLKCSD